MASGCVAYQFGPFRLDPVSYRCFCDGAPLSLAPRSLDLLLLFVSRPGTLVSKDEIMRALWPDVAVTDNALTQVISDLRQALGDDASAPCFIQTVSRRGYRFVAAVEAIPPGSRRARVLRRPRWSLRRFPAPACGRQAASTPIARSPKGGWHSS